MFNERPVLSSLLIALILFLPDPLAMLNVENDRKDLTSMVDEPEAGAMDGPEKIAASAECDVDVGINVERLDRAARLRGMIDNSISMRSAMSTKGQRGGRYYYFIVIDYANTSSYSHQYQWSIIAFCGGCRPRHILLSHLQLISSSSACGILDLH